MKEKGLGQLLRRTIPLKNIRIGEGKPKICVPIVAKSISEMTDALQSIAANQVDLVEWRVDFFEEADKTEKVIQALKLIRSKLQDLPLIFTFRTMKEGGNQRFSEDAYFQLCYEVLQTNLLDCIDIELFIQAPIREKLLAFAKQQNVVTIMSNHDFEQTPSKLEIIDRLKQAQALGADIPKIAVMPKTPKDVLTLLDATYTMVEQYADRPIITMAMGEIGKISRVTGELFGSAVTFAALKEVSAPGQVTINTAKQALSLFHQK